MKNNLDASEESDAFEEFATCILQPELRLKLPITLIRQCEVLASIQYCESSPINPVIYLGPVIVWPV